MLQGKVKTPEFLQLNFLVNAQRPKEAEAIAQKKKCKNEELQRKTGLGT